MENRPDIKKGVLILLRDDSGNQTIGRVIDRYPEEIAVCTPHDDRVVLPWREVGSPVEDSDVSAIHLADGLCPFCGSGVDSLEFVNETRTIQGYHVTVTCRTCGGGWDMFYKQSHIEEILLPWDNPASQLEKVSDGV